MEYNKNFRLQLRHGKEDKYFPDRDAAIKYIEGVLSFSSYGKEELLLPYEPVLFFYGEGEDKKAIVMVGLPDGTKYDGKPYFLIDTAYLEEKIDAEDSRHTAIEDALKQEIADRKTADEAEAKAREEADEIEASYREEADDELAAAIKNEAKAREDKDTELATSISNEEAARIKAVEDEAKAREAADEAEKTARIEMGDELKAAIDYNKDDIKGVIAACGIIYNDKMSSDRVSYSPDSHDDVIRDAKSVAEAVDKVSKFAIKIASDLKISVENTDTVNLTMTEDTKNGGNIIKADVNIAGSDGLSKKTFDNNIMGKTTDGLYAAASIEPSATNPNMLVFKTSGYVDGQFKVDAYETEVPLAQYSGDSGKKTGINVEVDEDKNVVSAQLNLSSDDDNILKLEDGEYIVEGRAKNIKYNDTTVAQALTNQKKRIDEIEETVEFVKNIEVKGSESETSSVSVSKNTKGDFTVSNDVKLSTDKSIIIANGGLSANVKASYSSGTSTLLIEVGNNSYKIDLSELAVSVLKSASYDSTTEEIILTFIVGDKEKTIRVPVGTLIHDIAVDDTDTIDLTLTSVSGGPNRISAELKVDKTHSDNILTVTSSGAYVSKAYITDAVKEESDARKSADDELKTAINSVSDVANKAKEDLAEEINRATKAEEKNAAAIAQEIKDARAAEKANANAIVANAAAIKANETAIADEASRAQKAEQVNTDAITAEVSRAKEAETKNANDITFEVNRATEKEADLLEKIGVNTTAVADNAKAIADEVKRAKEVENGIASDLSNEVIRAKAAEGTNSDAITAEVNRATTAEGVLEGKVNTNTTDIATVTEIAKQNKADITNEITRAKGEEKGLSEKVESEANRALAAEKTNADAISAEATRAKGIEDGLRTDVDANKKAISDEVTRATKNEEVLLGKINDEVTRAKGEEKSLSEKVATNAANITTVTAQSNSNKAAIEKEIERATAAENKLDEKVNAKVTTVEVRKNSASDLQYTLYVDEKPCGDINIPEDQFLKSVTYDEVSKTIHFVFKTTDGEQTSDINVSDLVDTYTAGNGIKLDGNKFSVQISEGSESYLSVTEGGVKLVGINAELAKKANVGDSYTKTESDAKYITEHQDISKLATKDEVKAVSDELAKTETKVSENADAITVINGNEATEGSIKKSLADAKAYADSKVSDSERNTLEAAKTYTDDSVNAEVERAKAAEKTNADAIVALQAEDTTIKSELAKKIEKVTIEKNSASDLQYILFVDDKKVSEINIVKDQFLKDVSYDSTSKKLHFVFETTDGVKEQDVEIGDLVDTYTAGDGLKVEDNKFSVVINNDSEKYLTISNEGLNISGVDAALAAKAEVGVSYTKDESDAKYLTEHQSLDALATKEALAVTDTNVAALDVRVKTNEDSIAIVNGNEATNGSIKKSLADAKVYADNAVKDETDRATAKEVELATEIATKVGEVKLEKDAHNDLVYALYVDGTKSGEITIPKDQFLKDVSYNAKNKELVFVFITSDGEKTTTVDVADLVDTYKAGNGLSISDDNTFAVKVGDSSEKYLTVTSDGVVISGINAALAAKAEVGASYTKAESDAKYLTEHQDISGLAKKTDVETVDEKLSLAKTDLETKISNVSTSVANEVTRATKAENALETKIADNFTKSSFSVNKTNTVNLVKTANADGSSILTANVEVSGISGNLIKADQPLYASVDLSYDEGTNTLKFSSSALTETKEIKLSVGSIIDSITYDAATEEIVISYTNASGEKGEVRFSARTLFNQLTVQTDHLGAIILSKETKDGKDILSGEVVVSTLDTNVLINDKGTLYVSNQAKDYKMADDTTVENAITTVKTSVNTLSGKVTEFGTKVTAIENNDKDQDTKIKANSDSIVSIKEKDIEQDGKITTLNGDISDVKDRMTTVETKMKTTVETVEKYSNRISTLETSVKTIEDNIGKVDIKGMSEAIEDIKTNLIGDKTNPKEGTIWYVINNLIDAGTYND